MEQMKLNKMLTKLFKEPEEKIRTVRDTAVEELYHSIDDYCSWAVEQGIYLPPGYETDPTGWNEVLNQIKNAFRLLYEQLQEGDTAEKLTEKQESDVKIGLELFGKYLFYLTDEIKDRGPAHG